MQTYKGLDPVQQPHTEEGVDTEVGVETHRKGVAPHSEKGVHYLRVQAKTWAEAEEDPTLLPDIWCHLGVRPMLLRTFADDIC